MRCELASENLKTPVEIAYGVHFNHAYDLNPSVRRPKYWAPATPFQRSISMSNKPSKIGEVRRLLSDDGNNPPVFDHASSYRKFEQQVRNRNRYILDNESQRFLDCLRVSLTSRTRTIRNGKILYRAQLGLEQEVDVDEEGMAIGPTAFGEKRMKPSHEHAREGRVNPSGIPVLYLSSSIDCAVAEVRPWIESSISVAAFRINRDLSTVSTVSSAASALFHGLSFDQWSGQAPISAEEKETAVWSEIDAAFSRPVTVADDPAGYTPTQILSELFRAEGYDAVVYRSALISGHCNVAVFDLDNAEAVEGTPYTVSSVQVESKPCGNSWYRQKSSDPSDPDSTRGHRDSR